MNEVRLELDGFLEHFAKEHDVEVELVLGGTNDNTLAPGDINRASDIESRHIVTVVIGADTYPVAVPLESVNLFQNADVTTVICKERCWGDHKNAMRNASPPQLPRRL